MDNKEEAIQVINAWLKKKKFTTDTIIYSIEDWRKRNEDYHNEAEFVIYTEGRLYELVNHGDPTEFYNLLQSFGYWYDIGNPWNIGIYIDHKKKK